MSTGLRFTLEVDGLPPDAFAVVSFHLNQSLSSLFSLDLSLVSQQFLSLEFAQVLDKMAYLTIWQGDEVQRRVKGVVTWFELGENDKNQMLYSMKVHPPLWRAGLRQNFRIFQNEDIKSILGTMLQENGVTEWSPLFSEPHPSREFCVQYGETDYDFLCRMAAEEGIFFYEEHAYKSTDQSLVLCDTVRHLPESFEIPWNPNTRTEVSTLCISQFRYSAQIRPSSVVTKDYTFKRPGWPGRFDQEGQYQDYQRTQYEVYDYPGRFKGAHGQNFARWQMDGWRNNAEVARGTSRSPEIWPGRRIVLTGHPQANLNREWQVVASELHGEQPQAVPGRQGAGTALENHFAVIPADRTWRPQPLLKPLVDGPQSAVVTGPAGEEIFCDEHGRVRVKFNWDRYNPADQDSSCWIRVAPELYQETLALYQGKLDGYTEHACREITLAEAPAWLLDYSWNGPEDEGNQGRISQIAVFQRRGDTLLTFTFSTSLSLKNSQKTMLLEVIKSFTPLPPENDIQKDQPR